MMQTPHTALSIYKDGAQLAIQPKISPGSALSTVETLSLNLDTGKIQVLQAAPQHGSPMDALAILGLCKLHAGSALVVVTAAQPVARVRGHDVFEVAGAQVVTSDEAVNNRANRGLLRLLAEAVDAEGVGKGLYFSYNLDLTMTQQHAAKVASLDPQAWAAQLPVERADSRFFWNKSITTPLVSAGAARFVQPCILGFAQQLPNCTFRRQDGKPVDGSIALIARRGVARAGTRQWRRGADPTGAVANFAETEQIVTIDGPPGDPLAGSTASYIIVRGSIPLLWTQLPNIKYKPTTVIAPSDLSGPAHDHHFNNMVNWYKKVVAVNLINHHGTEGKLEAAFRTEAARLIKEGGPVGEALRYVGFDFHAECGGRRYHRLSLLYDEVKEDFERFDFFQQDASGQLGRRQSGVLRINCIDCLDRTNVVQGVFARKALERTLSSLGLLGEGQTFPETYPDVEREFKILWADHGDSLSSQYAGTGAMKSGFTRTGKRTMAGAADDAWKAVVRYYLNNFQDGVKQDAIDLITGAYQCDTINEPPLKPQPSPFVPISAGLLALGLTAHNLAAVVSYYSSVSRGVAPAPAAPVTADEVSGLATAARSLLSTITFAPPVQVSPDQPDKVVDGVSSVGVTIQSTAASVAEAGAAAMGDGMFAGFMSSLAVYVLLPLLLGVGLLALVVRNGKHLVNKPQLCPQLAATVQKQQPQRRTHSTASTKHHKSS